MKELFNQELFKRIVSVLVFVPLIIAPLLLNNYLALLVFLIINSIILFELDILLHEIMEYFKTIKRNNKKKYLMFLYVCIF